LRDKDWYYSWYKPSGDNGGSVGYTDINVAFGAPNCSTKNNCNTDAFTNAVNSKGLCGKNDWRMPTKEELMKLVVCSDGKYDTDGSCTNAMSASKPTISKPTINTIYFANMMSNWYWSSSPYNSSHAWVVSFNYGFSYGYGKYYLSFVRLVR
jgi:hypothetical protein